MLVYCATFKLFVYALYFSGVCLSWTDFAQALKGFTPPSLWGVDLHTPSGNGLERVGGLREVQQQLMDTILLPAKVSISAAGHKTTWCVFSPMEALLGHTGGIDVMKLNSRSDCDDNVFIIYQHKCY